MPALEEVKSSWADDVEEEGPASSAALPPTSEVIENGCKIVTDYKVDEDGRKVKVITTYKIERIKVSKSVAQRKTWKKFGESKNDKPGPNAATTTVAEDVIMQFVSSKEEDKPEENILEKLKDKGAVKCRNCSGDHWTTKCPHGTTNLNLEKSIDKAPGLGGMGMDDKKPGNKYVAPGFRDGGAKRLDLRGGRDEAAIRVSNLSDSTTDVDLEDLVKQFGPIQKLYLAKDKNTNLCKGFAYIHFKSRSDAEKAIKSLNGHGYDHLILNAEWSKPLNPN